MSERVRPVLNDSRVVESWGGGWAPEQHTGTLIDGRRFYFRTRSGYAQLHVSTVEECEQDAARRHRRDLEDGKAYPPCVNPEFDNEAFDRAPDEGVQYNVPFWLGEYASEELPNEDDFGSFMDQQRRDESFKRLLDRIEAERVNRHDQSE